MIYLLLNCDEFLAAQRLAALRASLGDPEMADLNITTLAPGQATARELLGHASMMPFLAPRRIVIANGFLSSLDKRMAQSKQTTAPAYDEAAHLLTGLSQVEETCDLVFVENSIDKRRGLWRGFTQPAVANDRAESRPERRVAGLNDLIAAKTITLVADTTPDVKALPAWITQRAREKKIAIDPRAVQMLAAFVGANLRQLDNELDKLAAYASGRAITTDDILLLVSDASEAIIWDLTDALSARSPAKAMRTLQVLRRSDDNPFGLLALVARQYRIILKVKEAMHSQPGASHFDIAQRVGEKPYPVQKAMQQARAYTFEDLIDILDRLLEADFAMKTGADQSTVVDVLVAELTQKPQNASRTPVAHAFS